MINLDKLIKGAVPFLLMLVNMLSPIFCRQEWYETLYYSDVFGHSIGTSIGTHIVFVWFYFRRSYCPIPKCCVIALILMTGVSLFTPEAYYSMVYDFYIGLVLFAIGIALYISQD